jgi:hypothetical protein
MRFFWLGVDVALMLGVRMQKAPPRALRMSLILFINFGCGGMIWTMEDEIMGRTKDPT